jgi:hypothetical protein
MTGDDLDMPQPLSRVHPSPKIEVYPSAIANSPFAAHVMRVIACWAQIDGLLGSILSRMLKAEIEAGTAMYQALVSADAKRAALSAAASATCPEWQQLLLQAVQKATRPSREQRNEFAHGAWGLTKEVPDSVLLMPVSIVVSRDVSMRKAKLGGGNDAVASNDLDHSKIMVYRKRDFTEASDRALKAQMLFGLLYMVIGETIEQARRQLLNEPLIQQALLPLTRESSPEVQAILRPPADGEAPPAGLYPHNPSGSDLADQSYIAWGE